MVRSYKNYSLPIDYDPHYDPTYMSEEMLAYFYKILTILFTRIANKEDETIHAYEEENSRFPDHVDQGTLEEIYEQEFASEEVLDFIKKEVLAALERIKQGNFGFCEETEEAIGLERLLAVPYARYTAAVQEEKEHSKSL
ncbi:TraR/DksA family transcriptional regulator [Rickettsiales endosymbiont of Stachyamoeba lipophora]|uniref:TraR/DksA family transcriptional regulator n=1 Tax=Rickettsiales endosymbiont of Stachyamoeba lipophora TaxID=2486578 RepID=UPI000F64B710|nr:TraR/DksA family transcriptional regulator [Rickettsiales endosymbiont of Stachyamoeba lipophora]AZL16298.1 TraR/DksA family transcriptional regulator [Rickettsiales endosymbiont of Stachyamoeba lipophora]